MAFQYSRTIRFADTDAAGVVYFARVLSLCHEAYEAALASVGVEVRTLFGPGPIALPITHTEADFRHPLCCGDRVLVGCAPTQTSDHSFDVRYEVVLETGKVAAIALTRHVCIHTTTRQRHPLDPVIQAWVRSMQTPTP